MSHSPPPRPPATLVTPIWPAAGGNGLAMRAGLFLEALATDHAVHLIRVPLSGGAPEPPPFVRERAARVSTVELAGGLDPLYALTSAVSDPDARAAARARYPRPELARWATSLVRRKLAELAGVPGRLIVLRLYLAPYAEGVPGIGEALLDLDDDEELVHRRFAALARRAGDPAGAEHAEREAEKYAVLERTALPRVGGVLVCAEGHARAVRQRHPGVRVEVVPNAVAIPPPESRDDASWIEAPPRLLLVGNLGFVPNADAARWLCAEILPALRRRWPAAEARVVGANPGPSVVRLGELPNVEVVANPPDLEPWYRWASAALVPLRAGGGTRIKILEAFAAGVPVVSTTLGAEGLEVSPDSELLLGDTTEELAAACGRLHSEPGLASAVRRAARARVEASYARDRVVERLRALVRPPSA